ncbi:hypothetical protein GCM10010922_01380 [Microbacterium sorbitolivorans]|uniref:Prohead serine protease domain-containing protein n=1 Tax=Microbacterium sorbitolivorans TaxID=1867410 RepID=A0A367Y737_9MICO|nr:HK97 family phage prohead protease [Microbacterium sorbitolivorans]RCK61675.1 hypothetical protein DTO57_03345 [Microbacterium sorbitolivorans]GGF30165.1 hypothetical protein GCM10010922_01380 [Microbacterium sorbitolivorans]
MTVNLDEPQTRAFEARAAAETEAREISGVGVPLDDETLIFRGFYESFAQDCVFEGIERSKLHYRHGEVIGVVASNERAAGSLNVVTRVSQTRAGDDALTLARDGALDSFSIGFVPIEWEQRDDEDGVHVRHTKVRVNEFSLVPSPAYPNATVTEVRERTPEGNSIMTDNKPDTIDGEKFAADLAQLRADQTELMRMIVAGQTRDADGEQTGERRSAGAILQALVNGDEATRDYVNTVMERAYTGGTSADSPIKDAWVGDLTRIFDSSAGVLSAFFAEGVLPDKGMNIEYAQLKSNTVTVTEQENEGDDLAFGKVVLEAKTAPVKTYGGYTQLTRQQILRSTLPILDRSLEAMSVAAGARKKAVLRAAYLALVTARTAETDGTLALGATLATATAYDWTDLIVDAAVKFDTLALSLDGLLVSPDVFKSLNRLEIDGHKVFRVASEKDLIGSLDLSAISGDLSGVAVIGDPGRTGEAAEFATRRAVRQYDSAVTQLQDENIINLSKDFSVYRFGATATEIPEGVVPVTFGAGA